jgi:hypothetical protein
MYVQYYARDAVKCDLYRELQLQARCVIEGRRK